MLIPSSHSHLHLSKDTLAAALCCCHWCVLHCAQWLCRCVGSYPCCCCAVLCVRVVCWREGRGRERAIQTQSKAKQRKEEGIEKGKKIVPKWKARRRTHKSKAQSSFFALLPIKHSKHTTRRRRRRTRGRHTDWWSTRRKVSNHMGRWMVGMYTALSHTRTHTHCILHLKVKHE